MELQKKINVALISPGKGVYSETFIKAQVDLLPFRMYHYSNESIQSTLKSKKAFLNAVILLKCAYQILIKHSKLKGIWFQNRILHSLRKDKIDVVLAQYGPVGEVFSDICVKLGLPLIVHFHGYDASNESVIKGNKNYINLFRKAAVIIAVSRAMEKKLLALGCPRFKLIYNVFGPNDSFLEIKSTFNCKTFIGIGRFIDKKAPYYTIIAFSKVIKRFPEARLIIAGDGFLWNTCKNLVRYLGIEYAVELPGSIQPEDFRNYLKSSWAFVQHSIIAESGDSEGTPVGILEASAAGLPIISTKHAGIKDVIMDGETGLLVDEHDVNGMSAAMIQILENKELAQKLGAAGKKNIKENFSMQNYINKLSKAIEGAYLSNKKNLLQ